VKSVDLLIVEYPGDDAWDRFVTATDAADDEIDSVARVMLGTDAQQWLQTPLGALDGRSPSDVSVAEAQGRTAIRSLMMRLP
jgi:uncharacterized protein (DUF2384 family)